MLKKLVLSFCYFIFVAFALSNVHANPKTTAVTIEIKAGELTLGQLLTSSPELAAIVQGKSANKQLVGKIININGKEYEIRYFSFEDTTGNLPKEMSFKEYATKNNLLTMSSSAMSPLAGINFESFDYRRAKLEDKVYFSMAVRLVEGEK
jgi:hypothetical protein